MSDDLEELLQDAKRYRLLRNYRPGLLLDMLEEGEKDPNPEWSAQLDEAIDHLLEE